MGTRAREQFEVCSSDKGEEGIDPRVIAFVHFNESKYTRWYWSIIERARKRTLDKTIITELHHILPKGQYLFPEYKNIRVFKWNGVRLTLREHFVCHRLLVKMTTGRAKLSCAYGLKRLASNQLRFSSRQYEIAKIVYREQRALSESPLKGRPGRRWTDKQREEQSSRMRHKMNNDITRLRCSIAKRGKGHLHTNETKQTLSVAQRNLSAEQRHRKSLAKQGNKNPAFGKKWFNDGIKSKLFHIDQAPIGWTLGKVRKILHRT